MIIVTAANSLTSATHDRMPVLIDAKDLEPWLSGENGNRVVVSAARRPFAPVAVSKRINRTGNVDAPTLIDEVSLDTT